jgi:hypothetical protein
MMQKLKDSLWYFFVFTFSFQTAWIFRETFVEGEKWQYGTGLIFLSDIFLISLSVLVVIDWFLRKRQKKWSFDAIDVLFLSFVVWAWVSLLWAYDASFAFFSAFTLTKGFLVFLFVRYGGISLKKTCVVFLLVLTFHGVLGVGQWIYQYTPSVKILGIAEHDPKMYGTAVIKGEEHRWLRSYGGFHHPNIFGGFLVVGFFIALFLFLKERASYRSVYFLGSIFFLFTLFLTFSRVAFVSLFMGIGILLFRILFFQKKDVFLKNIPPMLFFQSLGLSLVCVMGVSFIVQEPLFERVSFQAIEREASVSERLEYTQQAFSIIQQRPFLGVGAGNFTVYTSNISWEKGDYIALFQPVHNIFLLVFSELGGIGFFLVTLLLLSIFQRGFLQWKIVAGVCLMGALPFLVFDHWLLTTHSGFLLLNMVLGFLSYKT